MNRAFAYAMAALFLVWIAFPLLHQAVPFLNDIETTEKRKLADRPDMDINHLDDYPRPFEAWYNDHFTLRNLLMNLYSRFHLQILKNSPLPDKVVLGEDDWLFPHSEEFDSYLGNNRFTNEELELFCQELEFRKHWHEERGIRFYFLIAPAKSSIHGDKIDMRYYRKTTETWGEQLIAYLGRNCSVKPIDAFETLRAHADTIDLYYRHDNHWNAVGAFFTVREVINAMKRDFPQLQAPQINDYQIVRYGERDGNIEQLVGQLTVYSEPHVELVHKSGPKSAPLPKAGYPPTHGFPYPTEFENVRGTGDTSQPSLLIISDSFGGEVFPIISETFSRTVKIFDSWLYGLNEEIVDAEQPDAVLVLIDEPILRNFLDHPRRRLGTMP